MDGPPFPDAPSPRPAPAPGPNAGRGDTVPPEAVREQVEWFTRWVVAISAITALGDLLLYAIGVFPRPVAPTLFAASMAGFVAAWLLARADRPWPSVLVSMVTFGTLAFAAAIVLPTFFVVTAALPGVASLIAVPVLRGRALVAMLALIWAVGAGAATVGLALHLPADADAAGVALTAVTLAIVGVFFAQNLFRLNARLRADRDRALASESQYRALFDGSPVATVVYATDDLRILAVNEAAVTLYGAPGDGLLRMTLRDIVDPSLHDRLDGLLPDLRTDMPLHMSPEWRHRRADGSTVEVDDASLPIPFGEGSARLSVILDVTATRRAAATAAEATRRLEEAQAIAHVGSWTVTASETGFDDGWNEWSAEGLRVLGLPPDTGRLRGDSFYDLVHPDDREAVVAAGHRAVETAEPYDIEHRVIRPDGQVRLVHERGTVHRDPAGRLLRFVGTIEDVTDRRDLERRLAAAERLEAVGRLAGGVAHDFNNLLTVISGNAEIALALTGPGEPAHEAIEDVVDAARRSAGLTRQLLAFARRQRLEPRPVDLPGAVDALASTVRDLAGPRITVTIAHRRPGIVVLADHAGLDQVILNLVANARDAMREGGDLAIETDATPARRGRPAAGLLVVRDSGVGMTPETAAHAFEPFFTTKAASDEARADRVGPGTGLGLAIVHGIVEQTGGSIDVATAPGTGTAFTVRLPLASSVAAVPERGDSGAPAHLSGRILVVEDDADVAALVATALSNAGHVPHVVPSGDAAWDLLAPCAGSPATSMPFDLVITDVVMPGISGWVLAARLRRELPDLPVVLMSGYAEEGGAPRDDLQAWPVLEKPFTLEALASTAESALARGPARVVAAADPD